MFVTVETTLCAGLGAFETTFCALEVTCWTGEGEGDPPLPEPEPVACEEEPPELEPPLDGAVWFEVELVDGWLEGAEAGCELERGGALEDGAPVLPDGRRPLPGLPFNGGAGGFFR